MINSCSSRNTAANLRRRAIADLVYRPNKRRRTDAKAKRDWGRLHSTTGAASVQDPLSKTRMMNLGVRFMETFQRGLLTFQRLRSGSDQRILVQHVKVSEGGQAIVGDVNVGAQVMTGNPKQCGAKTRSGRPSRTPGDHAHPRDEEREVSDARGTATGRPIIHAPTTLTGKAGCCCAFASLPGFARSVSGWPFQRAGFGPSRYPCTVDQSSTAPSLPCN